MKQNLVKIARWTLILLFLLAGMQQLLTIFMDLAVFAIVFALIYALLPAKIREKALETAKNAVNRG